MPIHHPDRTEARRIAVRALRPWASCGKRPGSPNGPGDIGEAGEPASVEGIPGTWRIDPVLLDRPFTGRTTILSPFDRLVHDRTDNR